MFRALGAALMDSDGTVQVHSDSVREALEYSAKLVRFFPDDALSYDNASNNLALISGKSALIFNPLPPGRSQSAMHQRLPLIAGPSRLPPGRAAGSCQH